MSTKTYTVDRIEGDFIVLNDGQKTFDLPLALLPDAKEGERIQIVRLPPNELTTAEDRLERLRQRSSNAQDIIDL